MSEAYSATRRTRASRRPMVRHSLWQFHFRHLPEPRGRVLDPGCGHVDFIDAEQEALCIAVDAWPGFPACPEPGVEAVVGSVTALDVIADASIECGGNPFARLSQAHFALVVAQLRGSLSARGTLNILQPNYRYAFREYFDDYTHVSVWTHVSLPDFLAVHGFDTFDIRPRFLPLSVKSRLAVHPWLIGAYLKSPVKLQGKQMLIRCRLVS